MPRRSRAASPVLVVLLLAPAAVAQPYWAVENGAVLHYGDRVVTVVGGSGSVCHTMETTPGYGTSDCYILGEDGDVSAAESHYATAGFVESSSYDPPLLLLDLPLTTDKAWSAASTWTGPDYGAVLVEVEGRVLGPVTTTLPGADGEVAVIAVRMAFTYTSLVDWATPPDREETWLLHAQLGRIEGLLWWEGIVPVRAATWGGVKSLYR